MENGGLTQKEAERRLKAVGKNELARKAKVSAIGVLFDQIKSPLMVILLLAALITGWLGETLDAGIIILAVVLNVVLGFVQEYRSEKSLESLAKIISIKSKVRRDGDWKEIDTAEVVVGDVVMLE